MAKAVLSEDHPQFSGVYIGDVSLPEVKELVDQADLAINIGALKSDFNTGSFSYKLTTDKQIELHSDHIIVQSVALALTEA
jgi:pyruvate decarboxylase